MNATVLLSLLSGVVFTMTAAVLIRRKHNIKLSASVFIPLLLSVLLYDFIVASNVMEHSGITDFFDPLEDIAEIVFTLVFLFFVNNWRKNRSEARFRALFRLAPLPLAEISRDKFIEVNDRFSMILGYMIGDIPTMDHWWKTAFPDPEYRSRVMTNWQGKVDRAMKNSTDLQPGEYRVTDKAGAVHTMIIGASLISDSMIVSLFDITERKREEAARLESLELLRATFNATPDGILVLNNEVKITQANQQFYKMWRIPGDLQKVDDDASLRKFVLDQLKDPVRFQNMLDGLHHSRIQEVSEISSKDDRVFECYTAPMLLHENEIGRVWNFRDITKQKQAEAEREKLQEQLLQAQKLEAIGILAGGVAHDFNNILGAIMGYAELTLQEMEVGDPFRENLVKILDAAQRSASLIRQLLIFARKQTSTPMEIDVNASVETMLKMLRRLIGENIELAWLPTANRCIVKMDPSQLDQILANLCVNARDAIADVGQVTIKTDTVFFDDAACMPYVGCMPGHYVQLTVQDNGSGMNKETAQRVFEPFFTTKGVGEGTGLGLSTVYGIVKQNQGFINLHSEPGIGTTFIIYIPLFEGDVVLEQEPPADAIPRGQGEIILLVEDAPALIEMSRMMLERLGYEVLTATTPGEAIQLVEKNKGDIRLFLTDVVMPEMNGRELIDRLLTIRPGVKHLFMSGYTADVIVHQGVFKEGRNFIQKPFSLKDLAVKVREVLDAKAG